MDYVDVLRKGGSENKFGVVCGQIVAKYLCEQGYLSRERLEEDYPDLKMDRLKNVPVFNESEYGRTLQEYIGLHPVTDLKTNLVVRGNVKKIAQKYLALTGAYEVEFGVLALSKSEREVLEKDAE